MHVNLANLRNIFIIINLSCLAGLALRIVHICTYFVLLHAHLICKATEPREVKKQQLKWQIWNPNHICWIPKSPEFY